MKVNVCVCALVGVLATGGGLAAAEPALLNDGQMDAVSAGAMYTRVSGMASADYGKTYVVASTTASTSSGVKRSVSSVTSIAVRSSR
ncbi:hypothetical protein [Noviherbaspirillum malthae]|uniref:hypothetical protein n=1 Tax=Noviherbaspirillum malthae TaxID=1260987 RepID=UPI001890AF91|nr:hypothetical protein [Noviherbaspirillum malthae]